MKIKLFVIMVMVCLTMQICLADTVSIKEKEGLRDAIEWGLLDDVKKLLKKNNNLLEAKITKKNATPLIAAAWYAQPEIILFLLEQNANVDAKDDKGDTALHAAAFPDDNDDDTTEVMRHLLNKGAKINATNNDGNTPLMIATDFSLDAIRFLVEEGKADITVKNKKGETAISLAKGEIKTYLEEQQKKVQKKREGEDKELVKNLTMSLAELSHA